MSALRLASVLDVQAQARDMPRQALDVQHETLDVQRRALDTRRQMPDTRRRMRVVRSIAELRAELAPHRQAGASIGLVPTMGALHDGHLSLIAAARRGCDVAVVSIFVNPTQFDEQSDLAAYPRQERRDARLAREAGCDVLFVPDAQEIYKPGFATTVQVHGLTDALEGAVRGAGHFRGVTTVVCKLLNIVGPQVAYFGQKDAQQAAVIRRMAGDLDLDVRIATLPIVREHDGLAMSSRNVRLDATERAQALALVSALRTGQALASGGERAAAVIVDAVRAELESWAVQPDYVALVDPDSFAALAQLDGDGLLLIAARVGETRLIDNATLHAPGGARDAADPSSAAVREPAAGQDKREAVARCSA